MLRGPSHCQRRATDVPRARLAAGRATIQRREESGRSADGATPDARGGPVARAAAAVRIAEVREITAPMSADIANAYIDFSKMTASVVAVVVEAEGQRV